MDLEKKESLTRRHWRCLQRRALTHSKAAFSPLLERAAATPGWVRDPAPGRRGRLLGLLSPQRPKQASASLPQMLSRTIGARGNAPDPLCFPTSAGMTPLQEALLEFFPSRQRYSLFFSPSESGLYFHCCTFYNDHTSSTN